MLLQHSKERTQSVTHQARTGLPDGLIPLSVVHYLEHTKQGRAIRDIARGSKCHASTILRQIRRTEALRDDPIFDRALENLEDRMFHNLSETADPKVIHMKMHAIRTADATPIDPFEKDAVRVLRRLCEKGAVLAVADAMETAVVVRDMPAGNSARTATVSASIVEAMVLKTWIICEKPGRISRYKITAAGRSALSKLLEQFPPEILDQGDSNAAFAGQHRDMDEKTVCGKDGRRRRIRYNAAESPVVALSRRRDKEGHPFLGDTLVGAAERLREDFELAQMGPRVAQNWDNFLTAGSTRGTARDTAGPGFGPSAARERVAAALRDLGPGLGDVALRCCCYLEGLETAEKRMGWSARSGKIVLRIALQRLLVHYEKHGKGVLIG